MGRFVADPDVIRAKGRELVNHAVVFDENVKNIEKLDDHNYKLYYYYKGLYYWGIEKFDSAKFCYNKLLNSGHLISDMEAASKGLMEVYHKLGEPDSVMKYAQLFANANDSACLISSAKEINRANALYNYNASKRQAEISKREAEKYKKTEYGKYLKRVAEQDFKQYKEIFESDLFNAN